MYFGLSDDQEFFQENIKKFLDDNASVDVIRKIATDHPELQKDIQKGLVSLGINNLLVPAEYGGLGLDILFATAVSQALGSGIAPTAFIGSYVMAPIAILNGGSEDQKKLYLSDVASGKINFAVGFSEFIGARENCEIVYENGKLNGRSIFVLDSSDASHIMVADKVGKIYIASMNSEGLTKNSLTTVDKTRSFSEVIFKEVEVELLEKSKDTHDPIQKSIDAGRVALAADTVGAAQEMINKAVEYSKERKQFGRVIGSFQAVKHMCAEMTADLEPCYAMVWHAAHCLDEKEEDSRLMSCHSKAHTSEVGKTIAKKATEVHGGMGFTDLLVLHYWFKRIGVNRQLLGAPEIVREEAAKIQKLI
jgi:alkylation response protein AidB-like acyl-CoA dehydrogenase